MGALKGFLVRLRALVRRGAVERELDDEIRFHLEMEAAQNRRLGMDAEAARRRAMLDFGGVEPTKEAYRDVRGARWLEDLAADLRYGLRTLRRSPVLLGAAVATLALGVGANVAIFSAVNAVVLRPLPFPAPGRLLMLWEENPEKGWYKETTAPANFLDWRDQVAAFQDVAGYTEFAGNVTLTGVGAPQSLGSTRVTGNFFDVLGVRPALGRALTDAETWRTGGGRVVVLSHRVWRERLGGDPGIVGRTIQLGGAPVQVVGVMPEGFAFPSEKVDLWMPTAWDPANRARPFFRRAHWMRAVARLRPGVAPADAAAQLQVVVRRLQSQYPETNRVMGAGMTPLHEFLVGDTRRPLLVLLGAVALLLLIACANVGNLLLVHAAGREREAALRLALGAGRGRLVRQALAESAALSAIGGAAGLALGWWGTRALQALQPPGMLRVSRFEVDWAVLAYVLAITTVSGLLFGIAPALWSGRRAPVEALKEGGRGGGDGRTARRWAETLVVGEVALALLLTLGAGLFVRSLLALRQVDPGFDPRGTLTALVEIPGARYDTEEKLSAFYGDLLRRVRGLPAVAGAAMTSELPLTDRGYTSDFTVAGRPPGEYGTEVVHRTVTADYFGVMRVPLLRGRAFADDDRQGAPPVVVINDALARRYFKGQDPIGQRITFSKSPDSTSTWSTIVGVAGGERQQSLARDPQIEVYEPFEQDRRSGMVLAVRAREGADPAALAPAVRRVVAEMDPELAVVQVRTMEAVRTASLARERFLTTLLLLFAAVGATLSVVGVYGVMAQLARRRRREMGIRIALGAHASQVRWLVVRHAAQLLALGLVAGTMGALVATRTLQSLLYHVAPTDPATFVAVPLLLALTGLAASWVPALQASRADPAGTLRAEG